MRVIDKEDAAVMCNVERCLPKVVSDAVAARTSLGSWDRSMGYPETAMAEAGIEPESITKVAFTRSHRDHVNGLLTRNGRELLPNLKTIFIANEAASEFLDEPHLARFKSHLTAIETDGCVANDIQAIAIPGHRDPGPCDGAHGLRFENGRRHHLCLRRPDPRPRCSVRMAGIDGGLRRRSVARQGNAGQIPARGCGPRKLGWSARTWGDLESAGLRNRSVDLVSKVSLNHMSIAPRVRIIPPPD